MNVFLGQAKLGKGDTSSNLDLGSDDIDTSDLLSDGVLDLDTGVDFNEIVSSLLIDQELGGTGISVLDVSGKSQGIVEDGLSDFLVEVRSGSDLDNL